MKWLGRAKQKQSDNIQTNDDELPKLFNASSASTAGNVHEILCISLDPNQFVKQANSINRILDEQSERIADRRCDEDFLQTIRC